MRPKALATGLIVFLLAGCNRSDNKLHQAEKSLTSWDATLALVQRQWAAGEVPAIYVSQLAESAAKALEENRTTINDLNADPSRRDKLIQRIIQLRDRAQQLRDAARGGGRAS